MIPDCGGNDKQSGFRCDGACAALIPSPLWGGREASGPPAARIRVGGMRRGLPPFAIERARRLRHGATDAERKLWRRLRVLRERGYHYCPIIRYLWCAMKQSLYAIFGAGALYVSGYVGWQAYSAVRKRSIPRRQGLAPLSPSNMPLAYWGFAAFFALGACLGVWGAIVLILRI